MFVDLEKAFDNGYLLKMPITESITNKELTLTTIGGLLNNITNRVFHKKKNMHATLNQSKRLYYVIVFFKKKHTRWHTVLRKNKKKL